MAKLTVEIDMDDSQDSWDELYRRIEESAQSAQEAAQEETTQHPGSSSRAASPATYDLLLDPDHNFGEIGDFFAVFRGQE